MSKRDASHNDRVKGGRRHSNQRDPVVSGGGGHRSTDHTDNRMSKRDASHNDRVEGGRRHSIQRDPVVSGGGGHRSTD